MCLLKSADNLGLKGSEPWGMAAQMWINDIEKGKKQYDGDGFVAMAPNKWTKLLK